MIGKGVRMLDWVRKKIFSHIPPPSIHMIDSKALTGQIFLPKLVSSKLMTSLDKGVSQTDFATFDRLLVFK